MSILGGHLTLKVNGKLYNCEGEFKYGGGEYKRNAVLGTNGVVGYSTEATTPYIEGNIFKKNISQKDITAIEDATVTLELADGTIFSLYNAWTVNDKGGEASSKDGKIAVRFEGMKKIEVQV
jgi:hypothetical protein